MNKKGLLKAILQGNCPRCREGKMYQHHTYNLRFIGKMNETCNTCGFKFEKEPGFFYGAMFVSYILSVGIFLCTAFVVSQLTDNASAMTYILSVAAVALILYPINLRYSRILFLHIFGGVKYKPTKMK